MLSFNGGENAAHARNTLGSACAQRRAALRQAVILAATSTHGTDTGDDSQRRTLFPKPRIGKNVSCKHGVTET